MDISKYKAEDFVLDSNFRKWVLQPGVSDNLYWERIFENFPYKSGEAAEAREIILNLSGKKFNLSDLDQKLLWEKIDKDLASDQTINRQKVIPLNPAGILKGRKEHSTIQNQPRFLLLKVAVVVLLVLGIGFLVPSFFSKTVQKEVEPLSYEEKKSDPGIKIQLTLKDGTKVLVNSGSTLRYPQEFPDDKREVYLNGEALFEIANDSLRPFIVHSGDSKVIALGTSFTVNAYDPNGIDIALLEGKVAVETLITHVPQLLLPGEALLLDMIGGEIRKRIFDKEKTLSWTDKTILLDQTPLFETVRILENWYGVKIRVKNKPQKEIFLSGKFRDETLKNVLEGLSYASSFKFTISKDHVEIIF